MIWKSIWIFLRNCSTEAAYRIRFFESPIPQRMLLSTKSILHAGSSIRKPGSVRMMLLPSSALTTKQELVISIGATTNNITISALDGQAAKIQRIGQDLLILTGADESDPAIWIAVRLRNALPNNNAVYIAVFNYNTDSRSLRKKSINPGDISDLTVVKPVWRDLLCNHSCVFLHLFTEAHVVCVTSITQTGSNRTAYAWIGVMGRKCSLH